VLVTLDTTRADALATYGGLRDTAPNLDALAAESLAYRRARTVAPLTLPAHASMFTGLYPPRNGVRGERPMVLTDAADTLAERARWAGFETAGFPGSLALDEALGVAQGFREWRQPDVGGELAPGQVPERSAEDVVDSAIHWLGRRNPAQPFFLWVHLNDARAPYSPALDLLDRPDPYLAEISTMDRAFGRLLDALGKSRAIDSTLILVVGDHGEARGEHGERGHGLRCSEATLRVPFLVHYPDRWRAGEVSDEIVSVADVFPTALEFMGMPVPRDLDGRSLLHREVEPDRGVYFETYEGWQRFGWSPLTGWVDAAGKYVHGSRARFYRPDVDPGEDRDLIGAVDPAPYVEALRRLEGAKRLESDNDFSVGAEVLADLAAAGHPAAADPPPALPGLLDDTGRPLPTERQQEYADFTKARELIFAGDHASAVPLLERICEENPWNAVALDALGSALVETHRYQRALPVLYRRLGLPPERVETHRDLVACFEALGDADAAHRHSVRSLELLVRTHERQHEKEKARTARHLLEQVRTGQLVGEAPPAEERP